jgi:UDP-N-acetylglucosamine--N-acetylmuramyl-(pentapeptide) pyrophosphoryl-undecaprenol N-acetylglucosamine transferase
LVFGGSRGARTINYALLAILPELLAEYQVIHITGKLDWEAINEKTADLPADLRERYQPFSYLHESMGLAFRSADLVVSRAGAATMGEFPAFGLPAILVPYPYAWRYQKVNADHLAVNGAAIRLNDEDMAEKLLPTIQRLMGDEQQLESMQAAAIRMYRPDAARNISDLLAELAGRKSS